VHKKGCNFGLTRSMPTLRKSSQCPALIYVPRVPAIPPTSYPICRLACIWVTSHSRCRVLPCIGLRPAHAAEIPESINLVMSHSRGQATLCVNCLGYISLSSPNYVRVFSEESSIVFFVLSGVYIVIFLPKLRLIDGEMGEVFVQRWFLFSGQYLCHTEVYQSL
jgi:hypothetical protein